MKWSDEQKQLRERFVISLIEATLALQQASQDREVTLELLIEGSEQLKQHLQNELEKLRQEAD